jgi:NAD(P)-dependent dehydrogenase (short-subunit alcohol dehydrogenase family)
MRGGVDVLVNNAGVMILSTLADAEDAAFDRQLAVNLKGTFNTLREAATRLDPAVGFSLPAWSGCCSRPTPSTP